VNPLADMPFTLLLFTIVILNILFFLVLNYFLFLDCFDVKNKFLKIKKLLF